MALIQLTLTNKQTVYLNTAYIVMVAPRDTGSKITITGLDGAAAKAIDVIDAPHTIERRMP